MVKIIWTLIKDRNKQMTNRVESKKKSQKQIEIKLCIWYVRTMLTQNVRNRGRAEKVEVNYSSNTESMIVEPQHNI